MYGRIVAKPQQWERRKRSSGFDNGGQLRLRPLGPAPIAGRLGQEDSPIVKCLGEIGTQRKCGVITLKRRLKMAEFPQRSPAVGEGVGIAGFDRQGAVITFKSSLRMA